MSLSSSIVIADSAAANKTFVQNKLDGSGSERMDITSNLTNPRILRISHTSTGKGVDAIDRHLLQFSTTETDVNGKQVTCVVNTTLSVPRNSTISRTDIDDLLAFSKNFLGVTDNVDALLRNES